MRGRRDPDDDPATARSRPPAPAVPTLGQLLHQPYWLWLRCNACGHRVAVALVPFVIRWGPMRRLMCCVGLPDARSAEAAGRRYSIRVGEMRQWDGRRFRWYSWRAALELLGLGHGFSRRPLAGFVRRKLTAAEREVAMRRSDRGKSLILNGPIEMGAWRTE